MFKQLLLVALCAPSITQAADDAVAAPVTPMQRVEVVAARDSEWASYRHAYKAAASFATYTRSRPLIQAHLQIRPLSPDAPLQGMKLELAGDRTRLDIAVDDMGRATIPMSKQAYDEDAVLRLNRKKGVYYFSGRYSIKPRADGEYTVAELRAACEQLIGAQRESGYRMRLIGKSCAGVKFSYPAAEADSAAAVEVRGDDGSMRPAGVQDGHPFEDNSMGIYKIAVLRFADLPPHGSVVTHRAPLAIGTLYE